MTFSVPGYRIEHLLGYGSQAQVWAARAIESGERVAIKRIAVDSPAAARAGRIEAALLSALDHPSLIGLRAYLPLGAEVALVMELAEAGSLAELLRRRGRLSPAEVVATISPVAAALAHAHDEGVLHADVSSANVLFTAAGQPKLADLGVARLMVGRSDRLGTPAYLDPVVAAGAAAGAASDVFALAAVALHALTGAGPWQRPGAPSSSAEQVLATAATGLIVDLSDRLTEASPELAGVLERALDVEPYRRPTAAELALDLRAALRPVPVVLAGGRIQSAIGRHSVERCERDAAARSTGDDTSAPAELTHVSRPSVRAAATRVAPARPGRLAVWAGLAGRARLLRKPAAGVLRHATRRAPSRLVAVGLLLALCGLAVAGGVIRLADRPEPATMADRSAAPAQPRATGLLGTAANPAALLLALDGRRARAYAQRQPALLAQVYRSPALLAQDTAQLLSTVPAGCQLLGLHTDYRRLSAKVSADQLQLQVTAAVTGGQLRCAGQLVRRLSSSAPARLAVVLTDTGSGYLIAAESRLS